MARRPTRRDLAGCAQRAVTRQCPSLRCVFDAGSSSPACRPGASGYHQIRRRFQVVDDEAGVDCRRRGRFVATRHVGPNSTGTSRLRGGCDVHRPESGKRRARRGRSRLAAHLGVLVGVGHGIHGCLRVGTPRAATVGRGSTNEATSSDLSPTRVATSTTTLRPAHPFPRPVPLHVQVLDVLRVLLDEAFAVLHVFPHQLREELVRKRSVVDVDL